MWTVWSGLALALIFAVAFLGQVVFDIRDVLEERGEQGHLFHWIAQEVDFDLTDLHNAIENAERSTADPEAFAKLRDEFAQVRIRVAELSQTDFAPLGEVGKPLTTLVEQQIRFVDKYHEVLKQPDLNLVSQLGRMDNELDRVLALKKKVLVQFLDTLEGRAENNSAQLMRSLLQFAFGGGITLLLLGGVVTMDGVLLLKLRQKNRTIARVANNLGTALESSRDAILVLDAEATVRACSGVARKIYGLNRSEIVGRPFTDFVVSEAPPEEMRARVKRWLTDPPRWLRDGDRLELNGLRPDRSTFPIQLGFGVIKSDADEDLLIASINDLTEQAERELNLMQARNDALQAERAKSRFLSAMSHEMRTPLNGVLAGLDLMRETTQLDERQQELARVIERCGDDALEQVENVLELTRLDSMGARAISLEPFAPTAVLRDLVEAAMQKAHLNRNHLHFETAVPDNLFVEGAEMLFRQIIHNFLSNALKFTSDGEIYVSLTASQIDSELEFRAMVADTGIGIHAEDLERIFVSFETLRESVSQFKSGTGLGLSIAKHSADLMGAKIEVDSRPGQGSKFSLLVSWPQVTEFEPQRPDEHIASRGQSAAAQKSILVVEDNPINRQVLREMLTARGHKVSLAVDGLEGVAMGREEAFDLILMDISMPKLDGVGATRMLRQFGKCQETPIVAVTAHSQPEHVREFLSAGMDRVLAKPLRMNTLDLLMKDLFSTGSEPHRPLSDTVFEEPSVEEDVTVSGTSQPPAAIAASETSETEQMTAMEYKDMIDQEVFNNLVDMLDAESVLGYLDQFASDAEAVLPAYTVALDQADYKTARAEAHRCAGGAAVIGAAKVHEILQGMTKSADAEEEETCRDLAASLPDAVAHSLEYMRTALQT